MMRRILFVDDEPRILEGLRRMLHGERGHWDLRFAGSGAAALAELAREPADVVVTDMRMPGMDGAELLARVATVAPDAIRIVLSGQTDDLASTRTVPVAHQFLTKPCQAQVLREVVERACALRELLASPGLRRLIGTVDTLPSVPAIWHELGRVLGDPASSVGQLAEIIEQDAGLSARVLHLVNSAFFGQRRQVTSVAQATSLLGTGLIRSLALAQHVFSTGFTATAVGCTVEAEQAHGLAVARLARALPGDAALAETAFSAGLLHDVGKLILATRLPQAFADDLRQSRALQVPLHDIELRRAGVTHAEVGAYLLGLWGLPHPVLEAVAHHHRPGRVIPGDRRVVLAVHVADALIHERDEGAGRAAARLDLEVLAEAGWSRRLDEWRARAEELEAEG
ncbi:MAG: HDOD domain-containing protein [Gemmatimonadetes bacterium]|nr:HDOD domain-containing protein [Gemmatimonadota bacterium]